MHGHAGRRRMRRPGRSCLWNMNITELRAEAASAAVRPDESHPSWRVKKKIGRVARARNPQLVCISSAGRGALLGRLALPARHDFQITPARFPADTTRGSSSRRSLVRAHGAWPVRLRLLSSRRVMQKIGRNHLSCHAWPERPS